MIREGVKKGKFISNFFYRPETEKFCKIYFNSCCVVQGVTVKAGAGVDYKFVTGPASSACATVVVSSASSQQAGHDPPPTVEGDGADTKGVLHTCPDSDARTP